MEAALGMLPAAGPSAVHPAAAGAAGGPALMQQQAAAIAAGAATAAAGPGGAAAGEDGAAGEPAKKVWQAKAACPTHHAACFVVRT